ncbi:GAF domain-containing protein [bacterium]|nr:GAF domain-containing protein [bacterium]
MNLEETFHPIFRGLDKEKTDFVMSSLEPFSYRDGEVVFYEGEHPEGLYLITEGRVRVALATLSEERSGHMGMVRVAGEYFGELSLLDHRRHLGTATAIGHLRGQLLRRDTFMKMTETSPIFVLNLAKDIVNRSRQADSQLILELARSKTSAELYIDRLKALSHTSQILNSTLDLDRLLLTILREATRNIGADTGTIYLLDEVHNELVSRVLRGKRVKEIRLPLGKGLAGYVAATGITLNIPDAYADDRFNPSVDMETGYHTKSILTMPMLDSEKNIVGAIQLINKEGGAPFNRDDEEFIRAMSIHASIAIRNSRLAEKMVQQETLAAVGNLSASLIHDFRGPMTIIKGYAQLLDTMDFPDENARKYLKGIGKQIDRMAGMTQEVLDFSRGEVHLNLRTQSLQSFFEEQIDMFRDDLEKHGIELDYDLPPGEVEARFDPIRIARVLNNLIGNSRDALPEGGRIDLKVHAGEEGWSFSVVDNGTGIPDEVVQRIFEPFETFGKKNGTGLGLAIAKKITEKHNGTIEVKSKPGDGTTMTLTFPMYLPDED